MQIDLITHVESRLIIELRFYPINLHHFYLIHKFCTPCCSVWVILFIQGMQYLKVISLFFHQCQMQDSMNCCLGYVESLSGFPNRRCWCILKQLSYSFNNATLCPWASSSCFIVYGFNSFKFVCKLQITLQDRFCEISL